MPSHPQNPTPYPAINTLLREFLSQLRETLADHFISLYLCGSLAMGGFEPQRSDIDFLVVTDERLPQAMIAALEMMHARLWSGGDDWAGKLEGVYMPIAMLRRYNPQDPPIPSVNEGRFYLARQGPDWVLQRHILRQHETIVAGPSLRDLIDPLEADELRQAVREFLASWWEPMLRDDSRLRDTGYQPYAVLTICRALYTLQNGIIATKRRAAEWAMHALPEEWKDLIELSLSWQAGDEDGDIAQTREFIRYAVEWSSKVAPGEQ
jgi:hypothetical protein